MADMYDSDDDIFEDEDTQKDKYLTFYLAGENYGVSIRHVTEIIGIQKITVVPDLPRFIKGVINLRGNVIPVMDIRTRFNLEARDYNERTCVIVVDIKNVQVGLVVDEVKEVATIPENQIEPPPKIKMGGINSFVQGIGKDTKDVKILLDVNKLLFAEELEALTGMIPDSN